METIRIDKWLWHARFFKTRSLASRVVAAGKLRIDGTLISKPARTVGPGNVLTFAKDDRIRVIQIDAIGTRRGPAPEAQSLYTDLTPAEPPKTAQAEIRGGRPDKRDRRRQIDFKQQREP